MSLKYKFLRFKKKVEKKLHKKEAIIEREKKIINIVNNAIQDQSCVLMMAPESSKRYIKSEDGNLFITINDINIMIANHKYHYDITINLGVAKELHKKFDRVLEHRIVKMEKEIMKNVDESLDEIVKETSIKR